jgi:Protein of unknown function, DUF481
MLLVLVAAVRHADAQIVNVQGQLAKPPEKDGVTGQLELKLDWREGNNSFFDVGGSGAVLVRRGRLLALALARGEYGTSRGLTLARKSFEHLRARYTIDCRWRWEALAQHEYDAFRRLSVRAIAGTGPALQIVNNGKLALLSGAAYLFEVEQLDHREGTIDAGARSVAHRASFYLTGTEKLGDGVSIVQTVYVQPRLDDPGDVRVLGELSLTSKLTRHIALTDGLTVAYDRTPPDGIKRYDTSLKLGLLVTF